MNKYILGKRNTIIKLNTDNLDADFIDYNYDIDRMWFIEEDGVVVREGEEYEVKKGDVVLLMYRIGKEEKGQVIIINNNGLNNYKERKKAFIEEEKNRIAAENCSNYNSCCQCAE